jgi:hypothetical protein
MLSASGAHIDAPIVRSLRISTRFPPALQAPIGLCPAAHCWVVVYVVHDMLLYGASQDLVSVLYVLMGSCTYLWDP